MGHSLNKSGTIKREFLNMKKITFTAAILIIFSLSNLFADTANEIIEKGEIIKRRLSSNLIQRNL